ncbi:MAG: beta-ketoacyl-ACP synthase II [Lachnospiraceae bacterium]|nr:beta-ketoacyl-ACP synthase II [Lachnospiraceae bacterium]MDY6222238.1 beta-ketoacyl-ACP synthase II [Candidatus Alectryocaccobium sp.]
MKRVVVTGIGTISPLGNSREEVVNGMKNSECGIGEITLYDTSDRLVKLAAEAKDYDPDKYFDKRDQRRLDRVDQFGIIAARRALEDAGLDREYLSKERVGVYCASGIGGIQTIENEHTRGMNRSFDRVSPYFIPMAIVNLTAGNIAIDIQAHGSCQGLVTACASSTNAIGEAYRHIKDGYADMMFAGGSEAAITELSIGGFTSMKALCTSTDPNRASIPFDKERSGFVMGEGASILVLEELEHALNRNAKIFAEIAGYSDTCDAGHITAPCESGEYVALAMTQAVESAGISMSDIDYINAHGTSTQLNDKYETTAIKRAFKENYKDVLVSSSKSQIGHLLGASGSTEIAMSIYAMNEGFVPPTINYRVPDENCDLNLVVNKPAYEKIDYMIKNSIGFGGHNASVVIKRWAE